MRLTLPAAADSVPTARRAVLELVHALGVPERVRADVALAVSEACTNVVLHAYRDHAQPGVLHVAAEVRDDVLDVLVSDEGAGVAPRSDSPGLGMGMALMAAVTTALQVDHDGAATRVHLTFDLGRGPATAPAPAAGE